MRIKIISALIINIIFVLSSCSALMSDDTKKTDYALKLDGEIRSFRASPDYSLVALIMLKQTNKSDDIYKTTAIIYDPELRKFIKRIQLKEASRWHFRNAWSPDGSRFAIVDDQQLLIIDRKGNVKTHKAEGYIDNLCWRNGSSKLIYITGDDRTFLYELDADNMLMRKIPQGRYCISVFNVDGKACVSYVKGTKWDDADYSKIFAEQIDTGNKIFEMPLSISGKGRPDSQWFQISPDGKYFSYSEQISLGVINIVAMAEDADKLIEKPRLAIMYQSSIEDNFDIIWPCEQISFGDKKSEIAIVNSKTISPFFLDLSTGDRPNLFTPHLQSLYLEFWKAKKTNSVGFLALTDRGLELYEIGKDPRILIKHTLQNFD